MAMNRSAANLTPHAWTIVGSGLFWFWVDVLFMGALFPEDSPESPLVALLAISFLGALAGIALLVLPERMRCALLSRKIFLAASLAGCASCLSFGLMGFVSGTVFFALGILFGAFYLLLSVVNWGVAYCLHRGESALACIAASFALAVVFDLAFMAMAFEARLVFSILAPLLAFAVRCKVAIPNREGLAVEFPESRYALSPKPAHVQGFGEKLYRMLGVSPVAFGSLILMMLCFGYMQFIMGSGAISAEIGAWRIPAVFVMQVARGIAAACLLAVAVLSSKRSELACKVGLMVAVAGFLTMPFFSFAGLAWLSGAMVMAGYTVFDALIWVLVVRACCTRDCDVVSVILLVRQVANGIGVSLGMVMGLALPACFPVEMTFHPDAIVAGYAAAIAAVLVVGSREVWALFDASVTVSPQSKQAGEAENIQGRLHALGETWGLTPREQEVFAFVAAGRSQPWISETLCIAEGTAKTHIRHIYQKAGVSSKQALLDKVAEEL